VILAKKECPYCTRPFASMQKVVSHVLRAHKKLLARRSKGTHSARVFSKKNVQMFEAEGCEIIIHLACPSCVLTFSQKQALATHCDATHVI
ncbi:hypothetical protein BC940DRAFT_222263, partial [Gongronella butleri]